MVAVTGLKHFFNGLVYRHYSSGPLIKRLGYFSFELPEVAGTGIPTLAEIHPSNKFTPANDLANKSLRRINRYSLFFCEGKGLFHNFSRQNQTAIH